MIYLFDIDDKFCCGGTFMSELLKHVDQIFLFEKNLLEELRQFGLITNLIANRMNKQETIDASHFLQLEEFFKGMRSSFNEGKCDEKFQKSSQQLMLEINFNFGQISLLTQTLLLSKSTPYFKSYLLLYKSYNMTQLSLSYITVCLHLGHCLALSHKHQEAREYFTQYFSLVQNRFGEHHRQYYIALSKMS